MATKAAKKTSRRRSWGTLRVMRNGRVQASYMYDDGRRYYATHTYDNRTDAEGWLANERKLIELGALPVCQMRLKATPTPLVRQCCRTK